MKLMELFFRDEKQQSVRVIECWEVRWESRYGQWHKDTKPEVRVFPSKKEAEEFRLALKDAFKLIKHTSGAEVIVTKQDI